MNCIRARYYLVGLVWLAVVVSPASSLAAPPTVVQPRLLEFGGPLQERWAEVSGLAWMDNHLVILPEQPQRYGTSGSLGFFFLERDQIETALSGGNSSPLEPHPIEVPAGELLAAIPGFDGLEAIGFQGDRVFFTVEAKADTGMTGYLLAGWHGKPDDVPELQIIQLSDLTPLTLDCDIFNISHESLVVAGDRVITINEANGANVLPEPRAQVFDLDANHLGTIPIPNIEYRVTDATALDDQGRFWVINYMFPPECLKLKPAVDTEVEIFGPPEGFDPTGCVERLLELQLTADNRIIRTATPPIYLELVSGQDCRNWEALVRMGDEGFLMMTDKYPTTLLAYLPNPYITPKE